jgi:hypothetical protein
MVTAIRPSVEQTVNCRRLTSIRERLEEFGKDTDYSHEIRIVLVKQPIPFALPKVHSDPYLEKKAAFSKQGCVGKNLRNRDPLGTGCERDREKCSPSRKRQCKKLTLSRTARLKNPHGFQPKSRYTSSD